MQAATTFATTTAVINWDYWSIQFDLYSGHNKMVILMGCELLTHFVCDVNSYIYSTDDCFIVLLLWISGTAQSSF